MGVIDNQYPMSRASPPDGGGPVPSLDDLLDAFADRERRRLLFVLLDVDAVSLDEFVADHARGGGADVDGPAGDASEPADGDASDPPEAEASVTPGVATGEASGDGCEAPGAERGRQTNADRLRIRLRHQHLPRLSALGLVEVGDGMILRGQQFGHAAHLLETLSETETRLPGDLW